MKAKHLTLIIPLALIVLNTLAGGILSSYEMSSCLLVDLSIMLSAGLLYYLFSSTITDAFKISVAVIFCFTGLIRMICMGIVGTETQNNIALLLGVGLFLIEIIFLFVVSYISKK